MCHFMPDPKPGLCYLQPTAPRLVQPLSRNPRGSLSRATRTRDASTRRGPIRVLSVEGILFDLFHRPQVKVASSGFSPSRRLSGWFPPDETPGTWCQETRSPGGVWVGLTGSLSLSSPRRYLHHLKGGMHHCSTMQPLPRELPTLLHGSDLPSERMALAGLVCLNVPSPGPGAQSVFSKCCPLVMMSIL